MWANGEIKSIKETDPEKFKTIFEALQAGSKKWRDSQENIITVPRSKMEIKLSDYLQKLNYNTLPQKHFKGIGTFDYELIDEKIILEYNGTYWHCDPRKYKADYYNEKKRMYAKDVWERDHVRKTKVEELGYKVVYIWEDDVRKMLDTQILEHLSNEINKNRICQQNKN